MLEHVGEDDAFALAAPGLVRGELDEKVGDTTDARTGLPVYSLYGQRTRPTADTLKGIDTLLRAMSILQERYPKAVENTTVAIIGGDPWADTLDAEMARLQTLRAELGIHDLVTFLGAKDQEVLPLYYAVADMVVMPSHYESFGMVALEAMAMGTPVIASEVGGLAHLIQHSINGFHVPSRDPEALAIRILQLLQEPKLRQQLGHNAAAYAQQYSWQNIVQCMLNIYEGALLQTAAPADGYAEPLHPAGACI